MNPPIDRSFLANIGRPIVIATHMRSGTHLTLDLLRRQFQSCNAWKFPGEANDSMYLALDVLSGLKASWGEKRARRILSRSRRPLLKVHWTRPDLSNLRANHADLADWLEEEAVFLHVVRHPYKVLASMWAWECSFSQKRITLNAQWVSQKILHWVNHVQSWKARPDCELLRFEDIVHNTTETLQRIGCILGEAPQLVTPLLPPKLRGRWHSRLNRLLAIKPKSTEILTCEKASTFHQYFFNTNLQTVLEQHASPLMAELGYSVNISSSVI